MVEIAKAVGARIVTHPFENQSRQLNWAIIGRSSQAEQR
jgi:hypothetical protein